MSLNYHIGRFVPVSLCVGDLVRLGLSKLCSSLQHGYSWETNPGLSVGILSLPWRFDAKYWCNVWWIVSKCLQLLLWSAWRRRHFFAPKQRWVSNPTMSQKMPIFIPYQRHSLHIASALQTRVDYTRQQDFGTWKVYCVCNVTFHAEFKYAIRIFPSPTVFVQWHFLLWIFRNFRYFLQWFFYTWINILNGFEQRVVTDNLPLSNH